MEEIQATDIEQFPGADVVRLDSPRWRNEPEHEKTVRTLIRQVEHCVSRYHGLDFQTLTRRFEKEDPRLNVGRNKHAFLLYGPQPLFIEDNQLKIDIKGLLYKQVCHVARGKVTVELP